MLQKTTEVARIWLQEFKDVRSIGFVVFAVIALLVTWSTVGSIETNYQLQKQMSKLQQENQVSELENANIKLKNQYFNTDQYLELTARKQFGKAAPGETVYIVPRNVALSQVSGKPTQVTAAKPPTVNKSVWQQNFDDWMKFLLHRGN